MCRDLELSYTELQELPVDVRRMWTAFLGGESQARRELMDRAKAKSNVTYTH